MRELRHGKAEAVPYEDDPKTPYDDAEARWEYTTMLLFNIKGSLYTYHHVPKSSERWMTFEKLAKFYAFNDVGGKGFFRIQDSLWLVWSLPDMVWQTRNPDFFKDDNGTDWLPN